LILLLINTQISSIHEPLKIVIDLVTVEVFEREKAEMGNDYNLGVLIKKKLILQD
jgi:hypothetical protein